jgi:hypothetical protein
MVPTRGVRRARFMTREKFAMRSPPSGLKPSKCPGDIVPRGKLNITTRNTTTMLEG